MNVVIVGGGTAGWMTTAALCYTFNDWNITIIEGGESIGVGESTTPHINQYLKYMGIDDKTFLREARATYKSSSRFQDFSKIGQVFHYPNGQSIRADVSYHEWMYAKAMGYSVPSFAELFMPFVTIAEQGKLPLNNHLISPYEIEKDRSFHIDAASFCEYLKKYCDAATIITDKVTNVKYERVMQGCKDKRIHHLIVNGQEIYADLFIDCTGQSSVLFDKTSDWIPYDNIITDTALVTKVDYSTNIEEEMVAYTNAQGKTAGWERTIPTWDFISKGLVYSSKFQSEKDAAEEFGHEDYRKIEFKQGRHDRAWTANCVAIGLSYGFIEPLESTSLFNTHHGILALIDILKQDTLPGQFARDRYNYNLAEHMDGWREFVESHYYYSRRRDTPFWRHVTDEIEYEISGAHKVILQAMVTGEEIPHGEDPIVYILAGSGYTNVNERLNRYFNEWVDFDTQKWITHHNAVKKLAEQMPTMHEHLKEEIWA